MIKKQLNPAFDQAELPADCSPGYLLGGGVPQIIRNR